EIADEAVAPVTVLQTSLRVAWRRDAEVALVRLVPGGGHVGDAQIAGDQGNLQLEPNEDVQVVGDLVGADAVGARRDMIDGAVEVLGVNVVQRLVKDLASARKKVPPERAGAADRVLPQPRLRLVNTQRHRLAHWGAIVLGEQALVVQGVANLVQDAEEPGAEVAQVVPCRDAAVTGADQRAEWVNARVEPPTMEVEAQRRRDRLAEDA